MITIATTTATAGDGGSTSPISQEHDKIPEKRFRFGRLSSLFVRRDPKNDDKIKDLLSPLTMTSTTTTTTAGDGGGTTSPISQKHKKTPVTPDNSPSCYLEWGQDVNDSTGNRRRPRSKGVEPRNFYHSTTTAQDDSCQDGTTVTSSSTTTRNIVHDVVHPHILGQHKSLVTRQQKLERAVYKKMTSLRLFPRQDVAFEEYHRLLDEHLGTKNGEKKNTSKDNASDNDDEKGNSDSPNNNNNNDDNDKVEHEYGNSSSSSSSSSSANSNASIDHDAKRRTLLNQRATTESPTKFQRQWQLDLQRERDIPKQQQQQQYHHGNSKQSPPPPLFLSALWCLEPRMFCVETSTRGQRKYLVGHLGRCMDFMWRKADRFHRHCYELIPAHTPCRLYLDLEFSKCTNPNITPTMSEQLMTELLEELIFEFQRIYPSSPLSRRHMVDLDSSTPTKFSRHVIVHIPWCDPQREGENDSVQEEEEDDRIKTLPTTSTTTALFALFADTGAVGRFVKVWIGRLAEELAVGTLATKRPMLAQCLFVNPPPSSSSKSQQQQQIAANEHTASSFDQIDKNQTDLGQVVAAAAVVAQEVQELALLSSVTFPTGDDLIQHSIPDCSAPTTTSTLSNTDSHDLQQKHADATITSQTSTIAHPAARQSCIVDLGVYSRNRLYRLMGSSKFGKPPSAALHIADANQFPFDDFDNSKFYIPAMQQQQQQQQVTTKTITTDHDDLEMAKIKFYNTMDWTAHAEALAQTSTKLYHFILPESDEANDFAQNSNNNTNDPTKFGARRGSGESVRQTGFNSGGKFGMEQRGLSPYPMLDEFVLSVLGSRGGVQGEIRSWSIQYQATPTPSSSSPQSQWHHPDGSDSPTDDANNGGYIPISITYQMARNRWCECIGRAHRSNNIMWTVDFRTYKCVQSCHDPDCRLMRFSGNPMPLPHHLQTQLAAAVTTVTTNRSQEERGRHVASYPPSVGATNFVDADDDDDDAEFEKALLALNLNDIPTGPTATTTTTATTRSTTDPVALSSKHTSPTGPNLVTDDNDDDDFLNDDVLLQAMLSNPDLFP